VNPESHVRDAMDSAGAMRCGGLAAPARWQGHVL